MFKIIVISAPSGAGKSSIVQRLRSTIPNLFVTVSATTRLPRGDEKEGREYHFLTEEEFARARDGGLFLESAKVHGKWYGTFKSQVWEALNKWQIVVVDIDVQGGIQIKNSMLDRVVLIFVDAPNSEERERRLRSRGTDREEVIRERIQNADSEWNLALQHYEHFLVNDSLERCVAEIRKIAIQRFLPPIE